MTLTIYHNPRCRKSREALQYLEDNGQNPKIVDYQKTHFSEKDIQRVLGQLNCTAEELIRKNETIWKTEFKNKSWTEKQLIAALATHPKLIERPIISNGNQAVVARPIERLKEFLK